MTGVGGLSLTPTADYANNINAGTATASYSYAESDNYFASIDSKPFAIGQADATVAVTGYTGGTYDSSAHMQTVAVTGVGSEDRQSATKVKGADPGGRRIL